MDRLETALDEAADVPLSCLAPEEAMVYLCRLQRLRARLDALSCLTLVEANVADRGSGPGRSTAAVLEAEVRAQPRSLLADQTLGLWLRSFPRLAAAFSRGRFTRCHLRELRRLDNPRTRWHLAAAQDYLVEAAESLDWAQFVAACRYWELAFDPDGTEPEEQVAARSFTYRTSTDGTVTGRFRLDPLAGAGLKSALDQHGQRLFRLDAEAGSDRTATQRRADALVDLVCRGAQHPAAPVPQPLVHIVVSLGVAEDLLNRESGDVAVPDRLPLDGEDIDGRCELIDGTPLHPRLALGAVLTGTLRRMIFGPGGEILDLGRRVRGFPPHLKAALLVRARGRCQHPGCSAPFAWLQADHVTPWTVHGVTAVDNGQILCNPHDGDPHDTAKGDRRSS